MVNIIKARRYLKDVEDLHLVMQNRLQKEHEVVSEEERKQFLLKIACNVAIACVICMIPILLFGLNEDYEGLSLRFWIYLGFVSVIVVCCTIVYRHALFGVKEVYRMQAYYCYQSQISRGIDKHVFCYYDFVQERYRFQELSDTHMSKLKPFSICEGLLIDVIAVRSKKQVKLLYYEKIHNSQL